MKGYSRYTWLGAENYIDLSFDASKPRISLQTSRKTWLMKTIRGLSYEWEQILQMGKKLFKIKSNPLANIGSRSVGKWDPVPKCG